MKVYYSPDTMRATWKPGIKLISEMINRAILDVLYPDAVSRQEEQKCTRLHRHQQKMQEYSKLFRAWKLSGLNVETFARSIGETPNRLQNMMRYVLHYRRNDFKPSYPDPYEWIMSDGKTPWTFLWCLDQIYGEADKVARQIRKIVESSHDQKRFA